MIDWDKPLFFEGKPVKFIGFSIYDYYYKEEKVVKVLNYYPGGHFTSYCERERADDGRATNCTHIITITERDGEPILSVEKVSPQ